MTAAPTEKSPDTENKSLSRSQYNTYVKSDLYEFLRCGETSTPTAYVYEFYVCVGNVL